MEKVKINNNTEVVVCLLGNSDNNWATSDQDPKDLSSLLPSRRTLPDGAQYPSFSQEAGNEFAQPMGTCSEESLGLLGILVPATSFHHSNNIPTARVFGGRGSESSN